MLNEETTTCRARCSAQVGGRVSRGLRAGAPECAGDMRTLSVLIILALAAFILGAWM